MAIENSIQNYKIAEQLYFEIDDIYNKFQSGEVSKSREDLLADQTIMKIEKIRRILDKIDINNLGEKYDEKFIEDVTHNIQFFYEAMNEIEKNLLYIKQYDDLYASIKMYIQRMHLPEYEYKKWAKEENELVQKFTNMLLHKDNIETFRYHIKRMILGTMSDNEFKKIFETNKNKMFKDIKGIKNGYFTFESFNNYKKRILYNE